MAFFMTCKSWGFRAHELQSRPILHFSTVASPSFPRDPSPMELQNALGGVQGHPLHPLQGQGGTELSQVLK